MYTGKQQLGLANAILIADLLDRTLTGVTFPDDSDDGLAKVSTAPRFLRRPGLQLFDLSDIYATLEAGIEMGRREAELDIEQRLDVTYDDGYRTGQDEGAQQIEDLLDEIELEFGEAGRRFTQPYRTSGTQEINPDNVADDSADNANFEGETAIPQGTFHSDVNLDSGDNARGEYAHWVGDQPGPDSGDNGPVNDQIDDEEEDLMALYLRGSFLGLEFNLVVIITDTAITVTGTIMDDPFSLTISLVPLQPQEQPAETEASADMGDIPEEELVTA